MIKYIFRILKIQKLTIFMYFFILSFKAYSEPFVILQYNQNNIAIEESDFSSHPFIMDKNYSLKHKVQKNETLSQIIENYYFGSGLDLNFLKLSIVKFNKHAFVRNNPNFLFADKTIHLPSVNEINQLFLGNSKNKNTKVTNSENKNEIFFFSN